MERVELNIEKKDSTVELLEQPLKEKDLLVGIESQSSITAPSDLLSQHDGHDENLCEQDNSNPSEVKTLVDVKKEELTKNENNLEKANAEESLESVEGSPKLSKSALKRKRKQELFEQRKKERRIKERAKRKQRVKPENPDLLTTIVTRKQLKQAKMLDSSCKVGLVVDLSFEEYMDERSISKCTKQVARCYSINRRAPNPVQFHVTSLSGKMLTELEKNNGYINWDVNFHEKKFTDVFMADKIVYLTSESDNVIEKIDPDKAYVIGGLVDHNKQKGLCHRLAVERGLQHGRLPIQENIDMKTRKVLTIDHVFHIIVNVCNGQSWKEALMEVLPARKGAKEKEDEDSE